MKWCSLSRCSSLKTIVLENEEDTQAFANQLTQELCKGTLLLLMGDLGAGKTTFIRHLATALGSDDWVHSPSYTLVNQYDCPEGAVFHMDLYRLDPKSDMMGFDLSYYLNQEFHLMAIEWADRFNLCDYPDPKLQLKFRCLDQDRREIQVI